MCEEPRSYAEAFERGRDDRERGEVWVGLHAWAGEGIFAGYMAGWRDVDYAERRREGRGIL